MLYWNLRTSRPSQRHWLESAAMNVVDAYRLLALELEAYRKLSFDELAQLVDQSFSHRRVSDDAVEYEITVTVTSLDRPQRHILVEGTVGATSWGSPLSRLDDQFVVPPADTGS